MQILQVILHFISANIVCIVKSIPTKENPKRFCTVSNSPFLSLSLSRLKTTEPVDVRGILQIPPADLQHIPACSEVTASHVLRFSGFVLLSYFQPHRNEKFQKGRGILREREKRCDLLPPHTLIEAPEGPSFPAGTKCTCVATTYKANMLVLFRFSTNGNSHTSPSCQSFDLGLYMISYWILVH